MSMETKSKQELADYRLLCVLCLRIDKSEEMYTRDVAVETQAEAEKVKESKVCCSNSTSAVTDR